MCPTQSRSSAATCSVECSQATAGQEVGKRDAPADACAQPFRYKYQEGVTDAVGAPSRVRDLL